MNHCCHQKIFGISSLSHIFFSLKMEMWNEQPCANQHKPDQKEYAITCRLICKHCEKTVSGSFSQFERCNVRFQHIVRRPASHAFSLRGEHVIFKHPTAFRLLLQTSSKNEGGKRNKSLICGQSHPCRKTMQAKIISAHITNICIYIYIYPKHMPNFKYMSRRISKRCVGWLAFHRPYANRNTVRRADKASGHCFVGNCR